MHLNGCFGDPHPYVQVKRGVDCMYVTGREIFRAAMSLKRFYLFSRIIRFDDWESRSVIRQG